MFTSLPSPTNLFFLACLFFSASQSVDVRKRVKKPPSPKWEPNVGHLDRHSLLLSTIQIFLNKTSKCNLDRRTLKSTEPLQNPARIMEALGNPIDVSTWNGQHLDTTCSGGEGIFSRSPEYGDALVSGDILLENLALSKDNGVMGTSKFGTCELMPDEISKKRTKQYKEEQRKNKKNNKNNKNNKNKAKKKLGWDHPLFRQVELARSLSDERLLLSNEQIESGIDAEIFSALSMVVRGSLFDMEIGTAAWHATSQGSLLWFALPPGNDLPFEAWSNFEHWIVTELRRMILEQNLAVLVEERDVIDPNSNTNPFDADDERSRLGVFGLPSHPPKNKTNTLLSRLKICQQHEGDLIAFPENWRRWAIALEDVVLISRRSGTGDTDIRKLRDRILDKAEETESTEDAKKIARDIGLLQKIEAIKYNATLKENNPFHVKTLVAKGTALASQGKTHEAATAYREAMFIDPTNMNIMYNLATSILANKLNPYRVLQAEGLLRKVVLKQPKNGDASNALAGLMLELCKAKKENGRGSQAVQRQGGGRGQGGRGQGGRGQRGRQQGPPGQGPPGQGPPGQGPPGQGPPGQSPRGRRNGRRTSTMNQHQKGQDSTSTARVELVALRRYRRDALRFARQAIASILETEGDSNFEYETRGRWHITAAKAVLNLQKGDIEMFDDEENKLLIANGYLCKGIELSGSNMKEEGTWEKVRGRLGLEKYQCD